MRVETKAITVVCDGCNERFVNGLDMVCYADDDNGDYIWNDAVDAGWKHLGGKDYCPDCWKYSDHDTITTQDGRVFDEETEQEITRTLNWED